MIYVSEIKNRYRYMLNDRLKKHGGYFGYLFTFGDHRTLHHFACYGLGLKMDWFVVDSKRPHYEITPSMQKKALSIGAYLLTEEEWKIKAENAGGILK